MIDEGVDGGEPVMNRQCDITPRLNSVSLPAVALICSVILACPPWKTDAATHDEVAGNAGEVRHAAADVPDVAPSTPIQKSPAGFPGVSGPTRIIHFPKDRSLGRLSVQTGPGERYPLHMSFRSFGEWEYIGQAIGDVSVPAGRRIKLQTNTRALRDLSPLTALGPNDLQWLGIWDDAAEIGNPDVTIMPHLQGLTGLTSLCLRHIDVTAKGLRFLEPLTSLTHLWISPTSNRLPVDAPTFSPELQNEGVAELAELKSLEVLGLSSRAVTDEGIAHLAELRSLRQLSLFCPKVQGPGLAHLAKLPGLERFVTGAVRLGDRGVAYLKGCTSLKRLELSNIGLTDAGMAHFSGMTGLEELDLLANNITNRGLEHLKPLRRLKALGLAKTQVNGNAVFTLKELKSLEDLRLPTAMDMTDTHLALLSELTNLKRLDVPSGSRGRISDEGLRYLSQLQHLEWLSVSGDRITATGIGYLARIPNLHRLLLQSYTLDDDVFSALAAIKSLTRLDLLGRGLTVSGLNQLNRLSGLKHLEVLRVSQDNSGLDLSRLTGLESLSLWLIEPSHPDHRRRSALRDEDVACLANLKRLKRLTIGATNSVYLTDAGMAHLAGLTELESLGAGGPQLTDKALSYLSNMKKMYKLNTEGAFTDQGLRHLDGLESLQLVDISTSKYISSAAITRLKRELPDLRFLEVE